MNIVIAIIEYALIGLILVGAFGAMALLILKKNKARDKAVLQKTVHEAIEKITADGKIEGPKGPYIPHERRGAMTDATTQASKHNGYYHHPWR